MRRMTWAEVCGVIIIALKSRLATAEKSRAGQARVRPLIYKQHYLSGCPACEKSDFGCYYERGGLCFLSAECGYWCEKVGVRPRRHNAIRHLKHLIAALEAKKNRYKR